MNLNNNRVILLFIVIFSVFFLNFGMLFFNLTVFFLKREKGGIELDEYGGSEEL